MSFFLTNTGVTFFLGLLDISQLNKAMKLNFSKIDLYAMLIFRGF
jgi:hypothetical protein